VRCVRSRTKAVNQTVERSPTTKTGSLAPLLTNCPGPTLRCTTVPPIGEWIGVSALI
jgi:hypothetical protein